MEVCMKNKLFIKITRHPEPPNEGSKTRKRFFGQSPQNDANSIKNPAFTLAEVLITLGIIGVVAAMTIPTLMNKTNDAEIKTAAKKVYSALSQATTMIVVNNDAIDTTDATTERNDYASVMRITKQDTFGNIFPKIYKFYKSSTTEDLTAAASHPALALADGAYVWFGISSSDCSSPASGFGIFGATMTNICGNIDVDVNGSKPPNMRGKDYLGFWLIRKDGVYQILPHGSEGDGLTCVAGSTDWTTSHGCTAYYMTDKSLP